MFIAQPTAQYGQRLAVTFAPSVRDAFRKVSRLYGWSGCFWSKRPMHHLWYFNRKQKRFQPPESVLYFGQDAHFQLSAAFGHRPLQFSLRVLSAERVRE